MNDKHNPIALTIDRLQKDWVKLTMDHPEYRFFRWIVKPEESPLIVGLLKLESSPNGDLPEFFVCWFTPFESINTFAQSLIQDWTEMWEKDSSAKKSGIVWDYHPFIEAARKLSADDPGIGLVAKMLESFLHTCCSEKQDLILALVPRSIADFSTFNEWMIQLTQETNRSIKIAVIDHLGKNYMAPASKALKEKSISKEYKDLGLNASIRQIASAGNPNDPEIQFRKCVFEMGDGVASNNAGYITQWGEKAIKIALNSGSKTFLGSAYLIYASFLLQLKNDKSDPIADKGIAIIYPLYKEKDSESMYILMQLYALKTAFCSIKGNKSKATEWAIKQARIAVDNQLGELAIVLCRIAAQMARKSWDDQYCEEMLRTGYHAGDLLPDDILKNTEIGVLAFHYQKSLKEAGEKEKANEVGTRMSRILGADWKDHIPDLAMEYADTMPDFEKNIEGDSQIKT